MKSSVQICQVLATFAFLFHAAAWSQAPAPVVREGVTVRISPHVHLIPDGRVPMVPNVGIVVGSRATLVIDPGMGLASGQAVMREVAKLSRNDALYIVNTHFHPEHTTGELAFPASARVIRAAAQQRDIEEMGMEWVKRFASRSSELAAVLREANGFRKPDELFERELRLDLGGVSVRLLWLGPGHTRGDTAIFVEGDGVLFSGDLAMKDLFPAFATPQSRSATWLEALERMDALRPAVVVGAHYDRTDASVIGAYRDFFQSLRARVAQLKRDGVSASDAGLALRTEFAKRHPGWDQALRVHTAATVIYGELP